MPPKLLVLVQPAGQDPIHTVITQPDLWDGQSCGVCERILSDDRIIYLIAEELRCFLCVESSPPPRGCLWCGRMPARRQDTGHVMCQPCWTIYVAYASDEVEPPDSPFRQLVADIWQITKEEPVDPSPPQGEDRPR